MPNLYGSDLLKDKKMARIVFNDSRFKPDWIKIYPTVVLENTPLYQLYQAGKYRPYTDEELTNLLIEIKTKLPYWVRVARIIRDIRLKKWWEVLTCLIFAKLFKKNERKGADMPLY